MTVRCNQRYGSMTGKAGALLLAFSLVALTGCPPRPGRPIQMPPPPLRSLAQNVATVNNNVDGIIETLAGNAIGISATIHDDGSVHHYDLSGKLRFLPPRNLYLDLSHLGAPSAVHIGSNEQRFWVWVKPEQNRLWWGTWADLRPAGISDMPLPPDMILAAMGLSRLPGPGSFLRGPVPQAEDQRYYKLLYLTGGSNGLWIEREYWLDRYPPFLPRVILFRQPDGRVRMQARLDDYRPVSNSAVYIARDIRMLWPTQRDSLRMRLGRLAFDAKLTAGSRAYQWPANPPVPADRWVDVTEESRLSPTAAPPQWHNMSPSTQAGPQRTTATASASAPASATAFDEIPPR